MIVHFQTAFIWNCFRTFFAVLILVVVPPQASRSQNRPMCPSICWTQLVSQDVFSWVGCNSLGRSLTPFKAERALHVFGFFLSYAKPLPASYTATPMRKIQSFWFPRLEINRTVGLRWRLLSCDKYTRDQSNYFELLFYLLHEGYMSLLVLATSHF